MLRLVLGRMVIRIWNIILKIQLDSILEIRVSFTYTEEESALARCPIPEAEDIIKFFVKKISFLEGKRGGIVDDHLESGIYHDQKI